MLISNDILKIFVSAKIFKNVCMYIFSFFIFLFYYFKYEYFLL